VRVVLDRTGRLSPDLQVFDDTVRTIIFSENENVKRLSKLPNTSVTICKIVLRDILNHLYKSKIKSITVEGGAQLLQSFISENLWAKFYFGKFVE